MRADSLTSDGFELNEVNIMVLDETLVAPTRLALGRFDGVIGLAAFKDVLLELDFDNKRVALLKREAFVPAPEAFLVNYTTRGGSVVPYLSIVGSAQPLNVLLDTGSGHFFMLPELDKFELAYPEVKSVGGSVGLGTGSYRELSSQLVGDITLGPLTWRNPFVSERHGNIGAPAFRNSKLIIDQYLHQIYISTSSDLITWDPVKPTELQYRLGYSFRIQGEYLLVTEVDDGAAADLAGLKVGDLIIQIDDLPWQNAFRNPPDRTRRLTIKRGFSELVVTLILEPEA